MEQNPASTQKLLRKNDVLFKEGEAAKALYLVRKGTISIRKMKGTEFVEVGRIYTGEVCGEVPFFDRSLARSASAVAMSECEVIEVSYQSLEKIYATVPAYFKTIVASMAERLRKADDTIRRLQKDVIQDQGVDLKQEEGPSASDVLAATEGIKVK